MSLTGEPPTDAASFVDFCTRARTPAGFAHLAGDGVWQPAPHLELISREIHALIQRSRRREQPTILVIEAPPRHGKSELVSKYTPAWFLCRWPTRKVLLVSYAAEFARTWGRRARSIIEHHGPRFGVRISDMQAVSTDWELADTGGGMATAGIGGSLTGRGADLLIIDDPVKNAEEAESRTIREAHWDWWQTTASTRVEPGGSIIIMATRWHRDDLSGRVLRMAQESGRQVRHVSLPAIAREGDILGRSPGLPLWPERWPLEELERIKKSSSPHWWAALYDQDPRAAGELEFPSDWFGDSAWFERWPLDSAMILKTMALDPSKGRSDRHSDYSAIVKLGIDTHDTLYVQADMARRPIPQMVADGVAIYREFQPHGFCVEGNAWQDLLLPDFAEEFRRQSVLAPDVWMLNNQVNKQVRIRRLGGYLAGGRIKFKLDCPSTRLLVDQLLDFPVGDHDDGPDALEMAIRLAEQMTA